MYKITIRGADFTRPDYSNAAAAAKIPLIKFLRQLPRYLKHREDYPDLTSYKPDMVEVDYLGLKEAKDIVEGTQPLYINSWKATKLIEIINEMNTRVMLNGVEPGYCNPLPKMFISVQLELTSGSPTIL